MGERGRKPGFRPDIGRAYLGEGRSNPDRLADVRRRALLRVGQQSRHPGAVIQAAITENA